MKNFTFFNALVLRRYVALCVFLMSMLMSWGQTTVSYTAMTTITCPATPVATISAAPSGLTFSQISRGVGVSCSAAGGSISGTTFNTTLAASISGSKWYTFTITSDASKTFTLNSLSIVSRVSNATGAPNVSVQYSIGGSTPTTVIGSYTPTSSAATYTITPGSAISVGASQVLRIYIIPNNLTASGTTCRVENNTSVSVTATAITPTISTTGSLAAVSTTYGTASASPTSFSVSGANMTAGILVTPPAGFEVSQSESSGFGTTTTVGGVGTIASTPVYVRLAAATVPGTYSGNIALSSQGATNVNVATVSSTVSTKNLTISGLTGNNKVYDGNTTASTTGTATLVGVVVGDVVSLSETPSFSFATASVGDGKSMTAIGYTLSGTHADRYTLSQPTGLTANIIPKALTITANNVTKTAGVLLTGGSGSSDFSSNGLVGSQTVGSVSIAYGSAGATTGDGATPGTYSNQVTPSNAVGGTFSASDYDITYVSGSITVEEAPANPTITVSGELAALSTTYGTPSSNTSFSVSGLTMNTGITITPPVGFEVATTSNFSTNIGTNSSPLVIGSAGTIANTTIYVRLRAVATVPGSPYTGNITLTSTDASPQSIQTSSSTVSEKNLTITGLTGANKVYDGSTTATVIGTAAYSGLVNGESFEIVGTPSYSFSTAAIGIGKPIEVTGFNVPSANYSITQPSLSADITPKALTITGASASNKIYDRTTTASISGGTLVGVVSPDVVTLSQTGTFAQIGIGTAISVTSTSSLGGAGAGNYTLTQPTGLSADITAKVVTLTSPAATNKVYDATTTATITGTLNGVISPDVVNLIGTGTFAQANTGSGIVVTSTATLSGANAGNYTLTQPTGLTANITAKALTITTATVASKIYDASATSGTVTVGTLSGFVGSETVTVSSATGTYTNANVGTGKTATIVYTLANGSNGGLTTNYSLASTTALGSITAKSLSITPATIASKVYNGSTATGTLTAGTLTGFVGSETVGITSATGVYLDGNVGIGKAATITYVLGNGSNGGLATNYAISTTTANGDITAKPLTVTANNVTKEIGTTLTRGAGSTAFTANDLVSGQTIGSVTITYGTGAGAGAAVGTYSNQVIPSAATGGTFLASNYSIAYLTGDITVVNVPISLAGWDFNGLSGYGDSPQVATNTDANVIVGGLTRDGFGTGGTAAANAWGGTGNGTATFTIRANSGYILSLTEISPYNVRRSGTGPTTGQWAYSLNGADFIPIGSSITWGGGTTSSGNGQSAISLSGISALQNLSSAITVTFRVVNSGGAGTWYLNNFQVGDDFIISGNSIFLTTTWNGTAWSNIDGPDETTNTIINGDLTTSANLTTKNLTINEGVTLTISPTHTLTVSGNLVNNGSIVFKSDDTGTARFGLYEGAPIAGTNITVERYIPAKRAWRLLTSPLKGSGGSIFANWQGTNNEGLLLWNPTGTASPSSQNTGLYLGPQPNIWSYTGTAWSAVANTNETNLFETNSNNAFLVFATGPHGSENITSGAAAATTTRATGSLITGNVEHSLTANQFKLIGNPYASPIHTETLVSGNPGSKVWLLDPTTLLGAYVTYSGGNWSVPTSGNNRFIQSGQAFFVRSSTTSFTINETHKVTGNSNTWFVRNADNIASSESNDKIRVLLYKQVANNWQFADGALAVNSSDGNNEVDDTDAGKIANFNESLSFRNGSTNLSIEYRALPQEGDVQPMRLTATTATPYQLRLYVEHYGNSALQPFLEDTQTGTLTAIPTDGSEVIVPFTGVVSNASTPDIRFRIVYESVLSIDQPAASNFSVYPNPVVNGQFHIDFKTLPSTALYSISTLVGQHVQRGTLTDTQNTVFLTHLAKGIYLVQITQDDKVITKKLYIQ